MKTPMFLLTICLLLTCFTSTAQKRDFSCDFQPLQNRLNTLKNQNSDQNKMYRRLDMIEKGDIPKVKRIYQGNDDDFHVNYANTVKLGRKLIPVAAHVLRLDDGTDGITEQEILDALGIVNTAFNPVNFIFQLCSIEYIDSTLLFDQTYYFRDVGQGLVNHTEILDIVDRHVERKLNIYFIPNGGVSWSVGPNTDSLKQHIVMVNDDAHTGVIMAHEIGHWFGLFHTHQNYDDLQKGERVDGSNCFVAGDLICDTPADPKLEKKVDSNCQYTPTILEVDANGDSYNPDPTNIMSYAGRECINRFSSGQNIRMLISFFNMQQERGYTFLPCSLFLGSN